MHSVRWGCDEQTEWNIVRRNEGFVRMSVFKLCLIIQPCGNVVALDNPIRWKTHTTQAKKIVLTVNPPGRESDNRCFP